MRQRGHIQSTQSTERGAFATATGSSNAFVVDLRPVPPTLSEGLRLTFEANHNITGATTVNVNSLGVKSIKKNVSVDLQQGDIKTGQIVDIVYDGTNFQILTGTSGFSGYSGAVGDTGTSGYSGFAGNTGLSGFSGETGASGFSGINGISVSGFDKFPGAPSTKYKITVSSSTTTRANALVLQPSYSHYTTVSNVRVTPVGYTMLTSANNHANIDGFMWRNQVPNGFPPEIRDDYQEMTPDSFQIGGAY